MNGTDEMSYDDDEATYSEISSTPTTFDSVTATGSNATIQAVVAAEVAKIEADAKAVEDFRSQRRNRNHAIELAITVALQILMVMVIVPFLGIPAHFATLAVILPITTINAGMTIYAYARKL